MPRYVARRLLALPMVLLGASLLVFALMRLVPGDAAAVLAGPQATESDLQQMRRALGLDQPIPVQYALWLGHLLQGDLGTSYALNRPVLPLVTASFANTLILAAASLLIAALVGTSTGVVSATRMGSLWDRAAMVLALAGNSMPAFWLGLVLILVFSQGLGWLPSGGMQSLRGDGGPLDLLRHLLLPAVTLGAVSTAIISRVTRASVLEVIGLDYVRTARAKGLPGGLVVRRHVLRNALVPVVTVIGIQTGYLLGGAILVETVFSWPGLGLQLYQAISTRDLPLILGGVVFVAAVFGVVNLVVDLLYVALDPRIRYE